MNRVKWRRNSWIISLRREAQEINYLLWYRTFACHYLYVFKRMAVILNITWWVEDNLVSALHIFHWRKGRCTTQWIDARYMYGLGDLFRRSLRWFLHCVTTMETGCEHFLTCCMAYMCCQLPEVYSDNLFCVYNMSLWGSVPHSVLHIPMKYEF